MKHWICLLFLMVWGSAGYAQLVLTNENNGPRNGDSSYYIGIQYISPGSEGNGVVWDFSEVHASNKDFISFYAASPSQTVTGTGPYNLILADNGYEFFLQSQSDKLEEVAMTKGNMTFIYSDPLTRMKFPLSYGQEFGDNFDGNAFFPDKPAYLISGSFALMADGIGILKLPGLSLGNVLRTKHLKTFTEIHSCNTLTSHQEIYKWYAPGYRYPVLAVSIITNQADGHEPTVNRAAYLNLNQENSNPDLSGPATAVNSPEDKNIPVTVYPNPFVDKLSYLFYLNEKAGFSLSVTDVYGNEVRQIIDNQQQTKGMHSGELDLSPYTVLPGVYLLKFIFNDKVITRKVVKIL